jgi:hypothetical protein
LSRFFGKEAFAGFLFLLSLTGCASLDSFEFKQPVKVLSDPPGAKVFHGPEYLGTAPSYIRIPREKHPLLNVVFPNGEKRQVDLETKYRWAGSFATNLLLLTYAPVGWAWDLYRGTAWNIEEPQVIRQKGSHQWPQILPPKVVAIAPPVIDEHDRINSLALTIEHRLKTSETFRVLSYEQTEDDFRYNHSYQGLSDRESDRLRLYSTLHADHILESKGELRGDTYHVRAELRDIVTGRVDRVYNWEVTPPREPEEGSVFLRFAKKSFHLIPNTVFISAASYTPHLEINHIEYQGKEAKSDSFLEQVGDKIAAIGIARLDRSNFDVKGHWVLDFVPMFILSKKNIFFPKYAPLIDSEFERWVASAGYGIETGYIGRYGFIYIDVIPSLTWTRVNYNGPRGYGTASGTQMHVNTELGYAYFISDHIVMRIFGRSVFEDNKAWGKAIRGATGIETPTNSASSSFAGLSFGYYFDTPGRRDGWKIR